VLVDLEELADSVALMKEDVGVVATAGVDEVAAAMVGLGIESEGVLVGASLTAAVVSPAVILGCTVAWVGVSAFCVSCVAAAAAADFIDTAARSAAAADDDAAAAAADCWAACCSCPCAFEFEFEFELELVLLELEMGVLSAAGALTVLYPPTGPSNVFAAVS